MALLFPAAYQFLDSNGDPVGAGKLFCYDNGTTNAASAYSDPDLSTGALSSPIVLDSSGRLTTNVYVADGTSFTVKLDTSDDAELWSRDDVVGWGSAILALDGNGALEAIGSGRFGIGTSLDAEGFTSISRTMAGLELTGKGMNTVNQYTPAIKFMSSDPNFTTENPKFLAAIIGEATEAYGADDDGGMALTFFATGANPGTTNIPVESFRVQSTSVTIPSTLRFSGTPQTLSGAGAVDITSAITHVATTGVNALTLADGNNGQEKYIVMTVDNGAGTLTPTSLANGTTITFDDVGDSAHLLFTNSAWHFMGGTATLA